MIVKTSALRLATAMLFGCLFTACSPQNPSDQGDDIATPSPGGPGRPDGTASWANDCDIRVKDDTGERDWLRVEYEPDPGSESVELTLRCTRAFDIGHAALPGTPGDPSTPTLMADTDYTVQITGLKDALPEIAISPSILSAKAFPTFGSHLTVKDTSTATVFEERLTSEWVLIWILMNERSTALYCKIGDADVSVEERGSAKKHFLDVNYTASPGAGEMTVELKSNKDVLLHHPRMAASATMKKNATHSVSLTGFTSAGTPQIEISGGLWTLADGPTWGSYSSSANGSVDVFRHDDKTVVVWMTLNGLSMGLTLEIF